MPDGRNDPCCLSCQWSTSTLPEDRNAINCLRHHITIAFAASMFSSDLASDNVPELASFIAAHDLQPKMIYEWISGASDGGWYSYFPGFNHQYSALTSIVNYASFQDKNAVLEAIKVNRKTRLEGK
jgi:hypothetical protein